MGQFPEGIHVQIEYGPEQGIPWVVEKQLKKN